MLVGGRSSRMGRDKAAMLLAGEPLAARAARIVQESAGSVALVGNPELHGGLGYRVVADRYPGEGPLGGILTALADTQAEWNVITACDMPGITAALLTKLLAEAERHNATILVPQVEEGRLQPLCAVYRRDALETLERTFAAGVRKLRTAFEGLPMTVYPTTEVACFQNLNTPEDWQDWTRYAPG